MTAGIAPVLRYPGGKARIAPWIVDHLPPHDVYIEPFAGGCAVLLAKERSPLELINDLDDRVTTFFRVLRDRPDELIRAVQLTPYSRSEYERSSAPADDELEQARRFLVQIWMGHAGKIGHKWEEYNQKYYTPYSPSRCSARSPAQCRSASRAFGR